MTQKTLRICEKGHRYYKSSDCNTCPKCEKDNKPTEDFLARLSSPARNALVHEGITTIEQLAQYTEKEVLKLHGIGRASLPIMRTALEEKGLSFRS
ncbi:RNA polymerase alpha subunit C-terminal domain-containing protein [Bacillus ndiopicus]|uniref:RNA polymerase alpha subunit C-terminal domain-containing protein n=1 Tax=Bacillus ndiopicus TaxID=1347368 RepID=UPI0005A84094|nr:RNA polymerase alpha subunit C-terminal domain-containing protein [Bacillus ndiopicus]